MCQVHGIHKPDMVRCVSMAHFPGNHNHNGGGTCTMVLALITLLAVASVYGKIAARTVRA